MARNYNWPQPSRGNIISGIGISVLGAILVVFSLLQFQKSMHIVQNGSEIVGSVVNQEQYNSNGRKKWNSFAEFQLPNGAIGRLSFPKYLVSGTEVHALLVTSDNTYELVRREPMSIWGGPVVLSGFGLLLTSFGLYSTYAAKRRYKEILWLLENGYEVTAEVTTVTKSLRRRKKRTKRRWVVEATSADGSSFKSETLRSDPGDSAVGTTVPILVHPTQKGVYYFPYR